MPFLLILLLPVLEIYVLVKVGSSIGVVNTLFALLAIGVLGAGLAKTQGRYILSRLQANLSRGEVPTTQILQGVLVFIGGILFLIPGFITDVMGLLLVLPGTRHLIAAWMRKSMEKKMAGGQFKVFTSGPFGMGGFGGSFRTGPRGPADDYASSDEGRDVTPKVIDVTPISSDSRPKSDPNRLN